MPDFYRDLVPAEKKDVLEYSGSTHIACAGAIKDGKILRDGIGGLSGGWVVVEALCLRVVMLHAARQPRKAAAVECPECMDTWVAWQAEFPGKTSIHPRTGKEVQAATSRKPTWAALHKWNARRCAAAFKAAASASAPLAAGTGK